MLLIALGAAGMLWAKVSRAEPFSGFRTYRKLAFIPLLRGHFSRQESPYGVAGLVASCDLMLVISWTTIAWPNMPLPFRPKGPAIPVKH